VCADGTHENSPAFQRRVTVPFSRRVPAGTADISRPGSSSVVLPALLVSSVVGIPPVNWRAIFTRSLQDRPRVFPATSRPPFYGSYTALPMPAFLAASCMSSSFFFCSAICVFIWATWVCFFAWCWLYWAPL